MLQIFEMLPGEAAKLSGRGLREFNSNYGSNSFSASCGARSPGIPSFLSVRETGLAGNERVLQAAWKRLVPGTSVKGRDGASYTVVYPGRPADGPGPDFRDAVLKGPDGVVMRGDVEIHVRPSGWRAHRHHIDPRYNGVAFHITGDAADSATSDHASTPGVKRPDSNPARTQSGRPMHLLVLGTRNTAVDQTDTPISNSQEAVLPDPYSGEMDGLPGPVDRDALARAGTQRFLGKSAGLSITLRKQGGDQAVWAAVLDCLGYSRNRRAFRRVAARLPWSLLAEGLAAGGDALPMLMWSGGFGPKPRYLRGMGPAGHNTGEPAAGHKTGEPAGEAAPDWVRGGRPDNSPERRLAAAASLVGRWSADGPLKSIVELVRTSDSPKELIQAFHVGAEGPSGRGRRALIGEGRAREIVVNAVLPLAHGWSLMADRWDVTEKALQLYTDHPKLPSNAVTREMVSVLESQGSDIKVTGAKEQQGLLLMYRAMTAGPLYASPPEKSET